MGGFVALFMDFNIPESDAQKRSEGKEKRTMEYQNTVFSIGGRCL